MFDFINNFNSLEFYSFYSNSHYYGIFMDILTMNFGILSTQESTAFQVSDLNQVFLNYWFITYKEDIICTIKFD